MNTQTNKLSEEETACILEVDNILHRLNISVDNATLIHTVIDRHFFLLREQLIVKECTIRSFNDRVLGDGVVIDDLEDKLNALREEIARITGINADLNGELNREFRRAIRAEEKVTTLEADQRRLDWLLTGKQSVSPQAGRDGTQGEVRVMQAIFASEDGAFSGYRPLKTRADINVAQGGGK